MSTESEQLAGAVQAYDELQTVAGKLHDKIHAVEKLTERLADSHIGDVRAIAAQYDFAAKFGSLRHELKCDDCRNGDHYHCAHSNPSIARCCCPVQLDLRT